MKVSFEEIASAVFDSLDIGTKETLALRVPSTGDELSQLEQVAIESLRRPELPHRFVDEVWFASQALKKWSLPFGNSITPDERATQAYDAFLKRNDSLRTRRLPRWAVPEIKKIIARCLPDPGPDLDVDGHFGPGAVAERYSAVQKWSSTPSWFYDPRTMRCRAAPTSELEVKPARLCAVPKSAWKDRLITVEPCELSFGQQYTRSLMLMSIHKGCLRNTPADFLSWNDNVEKQRLRCVRASGTGSLATVDLKDASDSITYVDVMAVFPSWLVWMLDMFRSTQISHKGATYDLFIYAGMGNATTFLVETVYFFAIFTYLSRNLSSPAGVTVFGDDVILDSRFSAWDTLTDFGLSVNLTKTLATPCPGLRESCGMVAYCGRPLTELRRLRGRGGERALKSEIAGMITHYHNLSEPLWCALEAGLSLLQLFPDIPVLHGVPAADSDVAFTPYLDERGDTPIRFNHRYQISEFKAHTKRSRPGRLVVRNLSNLVALGVLNGQLEASTTRVRGQRMVIVNYPRPYRTKWQTAWLAFDR